MDNLVFENCRIIFRNFSGKPDKFTPAGSRSFHVLLDSDEAKRCEKLGWNVKELRAREEDDPPRYSLKVSIRFDNVPPKIVLVKGRTRTILKEGDLDVLDWADIENIDLSITPYIWKVGDKGGVKAYAKTMYITLAEDEFEHKYYDMEE